MKQKIENIRNVAIIAHVDHGKTTLVDQLLRQSGIFRSNQVVQERVMDSGDIERERGITILSKNTAVNFNDTKINIIDTPGHADFGGEVERVLKMVDGVVLVVDAFEGPMPQTKFVLRKALELNHPVVVCVNKVDRPEARPDEVVDEVLELFMELDANDQQLDSPFVFASARSGYASTDSSAREGDMMPLFEAIINHIPCPKGILDAPLQALISTIDFSEYVGRIGIGKIENGTIHTNDEVVVLNMHNENNQKKLRITKLYLFEGLQRVEVKEASAGNIVAVSGIENIMIGDTICSPEKPEALPFVKISEPTLSMNFSVNDSPFAGQDGKFVTSRQLRDRLYKELNTDVSLRIEDTESMDCMRVSGRGELHLSILIETLRREGYEFQVSKPEVLFKEIDGKKCEPMEMVTIDVPEEFVGNVIEKLGSRKGEMTNMYPAKGGYTRLEFSIPARGLIGYRNEFLTDTKGNGILNSIFDEYQPYKGEIPTRSQGSLVAFESGEAITYGLYNAQERGNLFIGAGVKVYEGMIVGRNARIDDMDINVCKKKQLSNTRSSGSDDSLRLTPHIQMSLEQCMEFISEDELLEVTPLTLRMRKKILDNNLRRKQRARSN
ncbi:translational GTPase TypA [Anaerotignum sp. MB30-C6]|uniref:translational GTPase TypA n=1 Tax=Anaerotignum sp. MB30-C6 TaxID=3070814 RepID=UPI0027DD69E7|nr:translational GTPase TypA [Anaerotignum sp. MB30-C6]WMI79833.1 translational GTPase TypA [Anaerotignum sp. MB30-C6]